MNDVKENEVLCENADIEVITSHENVDFYGNDVFLTIPGIPQYCVGLSFLDNKITLTHALQGTPVLLYVESPTEAGAAMAYDPAAAIDALLNEVGITLTGGGAFTTGDADMSNAKPLTDFSEEVTAYSEDCVDSADDLCDKVSVAYEDTAWE